MFLTYTEFLPHDVQRTDDRSNKTSFQYTLRSEPNHDGQTKVLIGRVRAIADGALISKRTSERMNQNSVSGVNSGPPLHLKRNE